MGKYRKKPIEIEAVEYLGKGDLGEGGTGVPEWIWDALDDEILKPAGDGSDSFTIETLEGEMKVSPGDWIIQGIKGELYPCKPDIFDATYDEVLP